MKLSEKVLIVVIAMATAWLCVVSLRHSSRIKALETLFTESQTCIVSNDCVFVGQQTNQWIRATWMGLTNK
jgi:hypothetical protein